MHISQMIEFSAIRRREYEAHMNSFSHSNTTIEDDDAENYKNHLLALFSQLEKGPYLDVRS